MEIPPSNGRFMWSREGNMISCSLSDRFLVSPDWDEAFENSRVASQVHIHLDHFLILLEAGSFEWDPSPFRFVIVGF